MGKYKYRYGNGFAFQEKKDLNMMEEMARKGYFPVGANALGFYRFVPGPPEEVAYSMDISNVRQCSEEFADYEEIFKSGGWEHVFSLDNVHFFKAPKGTTPIYTDKPSEAQKHQNMTRISLRSVLATVPVAVISLALFRMSTVFLFRVFFALVGGASLGVALTMSVGVIINWVRAARSK